MIEILKIIGSALVTASVTIYALHIKRKWEKQDKQDESNDTMEDKIDNLTREVAQLGKKVEKLSSDLDKEIADNCSLQAGLREMLYDRIKHLCRRYETEGEIREEEYNSLKRMWQVYHNDLGGNGYLNSEMEVIETLKKI